MIKRKIEPYEVAVLKALVVQYGDGLSDIYKYLPLETQPFLSKKDKAKYKITVIRQMEIVLKLAEDHVLEIDQIINTKSPGYVSMSAEPEPVMYWKNNTRWAKRHFQYDGVIPIENVYKQHGSSIFIKLTADDINQLYNDYIAEHTVFFKFDAAHNRFCIKIDDGDWVKVAGIYQDTLVYKILSAAWKSSNKSTTLDKLCGNGNIDKKYKDCYMSNLCQKNSAVRALEPKIIEMDLHGISLKQSAKYTYSELFDLKTSLRI